jgi:hypothetical protein
MLGLLLASGLAALLGAAKGAKPLDLAARQSAITAGSYAVVIGINSYEEQGIPPLKFAENDARAFAQVLSGACGYPASHVYELLGPQATLKAIMQRVFALGEAGVYPQADTVVFYFSGHGAALSGENYLIPYDGTADAALAENLNIALPKVLEQLKRHFKTQVVFLDACRNLADVGSRGMGGGGFVDPGLAAHEARGLCVMFGTELGQLSREDEELGHGLFTAALLAGLSGGAADAQGSIFVGDLAKYVAGYMLDYSQREPDKRQKPYIAGEYSPLITLAIAQPSGAGSLNTQPGPGGAEPCFAPGAKVTLIVTVKAPKDWHLNHFVPLKVEFDEDYLKRAPFKVEQAKWSFPLPDLPRQLQSWDLQIPILLEPDIGSGRQLIWLKLYVGLENDPGSLCAYPSANVYIPLQVAPSRDSGGRSAALPGGELTYTWECPKPD